MSSNSVIVIVFSFLALLSCQNDSKPDHLIGESVMIEMMAEIHVAEAMAGRLELDSYDSSQVAYKYLEHQIYEKFGVDSAIYVHNYDYYARNPRLFEKMYEEVEKKLTIDEKEEIDPL